MKRIFRLLARVVYPVPYPFAAGYHALVGATAFWLLMGSPAKYSIGVVLVSALAGIAIGAMLVAVVGKQLEDEA